MAVGGLVAGDAFLAVERVAIAGAEQDLRDEFLGFLVERELDVVVGRFIDDGVGAEVFAEELARFKGGVGGEFEVGHGKNVEVVD